MGTGVELRNKRLSLLLFQFGAVLKSWKRKKFCDLWQDRIKVKVKDFFTTFALCKTVIYSRICEYEYSVAHQSITRNKNASSILVHYPLWIISWIV